MHRQLLHTLFALPPRAQGVVGEIFITSLLVDMGLRVCRFIWLLRLLQRPTRGLIHEDSTRKIMLAELCSLAAAVFRHYPFHLTCLKRALILHALMRRRGLQPVLKIGLRKDGQQLQAHAWLEQDGELIMEAPDIVEQYESVLVFGSHVGLAESHFVADHNRIG